MFDKMGERIKDKRTALKMSLSELSTKVGVGASTVSKWERGFIKDMRSDKIQKVAAALDVTPAYLMGWEEGQNLTIAANAIDNNGVIGNTKGDVTIKNGVSKTKLGKEETELLRIFGALSVKSRMTLLSTAMNLEEEERGE